MRSGCAWRITLTHSISDSDLIGWTEEARRVEGFTDGNKNTDGFTDGQDELNDFKREVLASQAVQSINDPLHTRAAGVFKHGYYTLPIGSWKMSTCVFASMQGFTDMVALHACKYTCGQSLGAHDFA